MDSGQSLAFADRDGYVGVFEGAHPSNSQSAGTAEPDPLAEDSLLMEVGLLGF